MKTDLDTLKDWFKIGYEAFEESKLEAAKTVDYYHNRQYNEDQIGILAERGQPAETFNVVKLFGRLIVGYYTTVVNALKTKSRLEKNILISQLLNDVLEFTLEDNNFETVGNRVKLEAYLTGLFAVQLTVEDEDSKDQYGRPKRRVKINDVPYRELVLDPMSTNEDYSLDARFIMRHKWISEEALREFLEDEGKTAQPIIDGLVAYENHANQEDTDWLRFYKDQFSGLNNQYDNFLVIHAEIIDDKKQMWSIHWCGDDIISKKKIESFSYCTLALNDSDITEHYGLFRGVLESQEAINQAICKIQLMANSQKIFVNENAVNNLAHFTKVVNQINAIIPCLDIAGIKVENLGQSVLEQYTIIDKAMERIKYVLGVNDSFLGAAYASDSGRKVKLQQDMTIMALSHITDKTKQFYRLMGWKIIKLVKKYYTANEVLRITSEPIGDRWIELNKPVELPTDQVDPNTGQAKTETAYENVEDPETGEQQVDENGNLLIAPIGEPDTEIKFAEVDLSIDSTAFNDEDERNQLMLETFISGPAGQILAQTNLPGYLEIIALNVRNKRTKDSHMMFEIIKKTAESLAQQQGQQPGEQRAQAQGEAGPVKGIQQGAKSSSLKLPQNTNE